MNNKQIMIASNFVAGLAFWISPAFAVVAVLFGAFVAKRQDWPVVG